MNDSQKLEKILQYLKIVKKYITDQRIILENISPHSEGILILKRLETMMSVFDRYDLIAGGGK